MRRRGLTEEDRAAWAGYVSRVAQLAGGPAPPALPAPTPQPAQLQPPQLQPPRPQLSRPPEPAPASVRLRARPDAVQVGTHPGGVDTGTWTRFRTGKLPTARTLDLHGRTAQAAFGALQVFLRASHADGVRCVEVITGRGQGEGGVIRRELPHWLNAPELRPLVLAASHPHAANPGSVRVLLRRARRPAPV